MKIFGRILRENMVFGEKKRLIFLKNVLRLPF